MILQPLICPLTLLDTILCQSNVLHCENKYLQVSHFVHYLESQQLFPIQFFELANDEVAIHL